MPTLNQLPKMNMDSSETNCCPEFDPKGWDEQKFVFKDKKFVKMLTINFLHIPINMGFVMKKMWEKVTSANADEKDQYLMLSYDLSPWKSEHYYAVTKEVPDLENVKISGTFLTKVFEGEFKNAPKWVKEMEAYVTSKKKKAKKIYFFYTTCPKCYKHYGKNFLVAFAQV